MSARLFLAWHLRQVSHKTPSGFISLMVESFVPKIRQSAARGSCAYYCFQYFVHVEAIHPSLNLSNSCPFALIRSVLSAVTDASHFLISTHRLPGLPLIYSLCHSPLCVYRCLTYGIVMHISSPQQIRHAMAVISLIKDLNLPSIMFYSYVVSLPGELCARIWQLSLTKVARQQPYH